MNKYILGFITILSLTLVSCASSQSTTTVSDGINITDYKHVVYGDDDKDGAAELTDILLLVQNELSGKMSEFPLVTGTAHYVLLTFANTTRMESCHNDFSFVLHHWHLTPFTERLTMQRGFHGLLYPRPASSSSSFSCPPPRQQQRLRLLVTSVPLPSFSHYTLYLFAFK